mgnify:CR=1 FL=1
MVNVTAKINQRQISTVPRFSVGPEETLAHRSVFHLVGSEKVRRGMKGDQNEERQWESRQTKCNGLY